MLGHTIFDEFCGEGQPSLFGLDEKLRGKEKEEDEEDNKGL